MITPEEMFAANTLNLESGSGESNIRNDSQIDESVRKPDDDH